MSVMVDALQTGPVSANTYILTDKNTLQTAVIDTGECTEKLLGMLEGKDVRYILLTHGHYDHILGVYKLKQKTGAEVVIHRLDADCLENGNKSLSAYSFNQHSVHADRILDGGERITLGETIIDVMHTPGHTPGGVCYILAKDRIIFTGDTLFCGSVGRTDLPGGDWNTLRESLEKIAGLHGDYAVMPGHDISSTLDRERQTNMFLRGF